MKVLMTRCLSIAFVLLIAGCAGYWGKRPLDQPTRLNPRNPVWIWTGGEVEKWHEVVITPDSVSGIPFDQPLQCAFCRQSVPRTRVDSMKLGYKTRVQSITEFVGVVTAAILAEAAVCAVVAPHDGQC